MSRAAMAQTKKAPLQQPQPDEPLPGKEPPLVGGQKAEGAGRATGLAPSFVPPSGKAYGSTMIYGPSTHSLARAF